jgi:uncharacterized protein
MKGGLAIFVKTPGVSALKTRLAASIGNESAAHWYLNAVRAVESVALKAQSHTGIHAYWAVAETEALQTPLWQNLPRLAQAENTEDDLGTRMGRVMRMLIRQHGFGVLIGADTPQLCASDIEAAAIFLNHPSPRLVLGPAQDGGFWCVGSNQTLPIELWQSVTYSQANVYRDFVEAFSPFVEISNLRTLSDVDVVANLKSCNDEMKWLPQPTSAQLALLEQFGGTELLT